jgi:hypothetical protein
MTRRVVHIRTGRAQRRLRRRNNIRTSLRLVFTRRRLGRDFRDATRRFF